LRISLISKLTIGTSLILLVFMVFFAYINIATLKTMLMADAMAMLPADRTTFAAGEEVDVHILSGNVEMLEG